MAHEGGSGGGGSKKKKPSFLRSCLTSAVAIVVIIYVGVLLVTAGITTFLNNRDKTTLTASASSAPPANPPANQAVVVTATPIIIAAINGSNSTGGAGSGPQNAPPAPLISSAGFTATGPFYIVEQADLSQNDQPLSFDASMSLIAAKLLTTVDALKQINPALSSRTLVAGQVLNVPADVISGGGGGNLPPTGEYASP